MCFSQDQWLLPYSSASSPAPSSSPPEPSATYIDYPSSNDDNHFDEQLPLTPASAPSATHDLTVCQAWDDWKFVLDDMDWDESLATVTFPDGQVYTSKSIVLDCLGPRPHYRFITKVKDLTSIRATKSTISPRVAFESMAQALQKSLAVSQSSENLHPLNIGFLVSFDEEKLLVRWCLHVVEHFPPVTQTGM